jgi:hypothetical protein
MRLRPPTMAELAEMIREEHDEERRSQLLDWYWAKAVDEHGALIAHWHRQEYEWLVAERSRSTGAAA